FAPSSERTQALGQQVKTKSDELMKKHNRLTTTLTTAACLAGARVDVARRETRNKLTMKKISLIGILLGIAIVPAAVANTITGSQTPNASFLDGGEITAITTPPVLLGMPGPGGPP